jgi:hypothetical protein
MVVASINDLLAWFFLALAANKPMLKNPDLIERGQMPRIAPQRISRGAIFFLCATPQWPECCCDGCKDA